MIEALGRDVRVAVRRLWRTPSFTVAAVLTLAIGIGATTAVFSVVYGVLVRPLPFPTAARFVHVVQVLPPDSGGEPLRAGLTPGQIAEWRATSRTLAEIGTYADRSASLTNVPTPMRLNGVAISVSLFRATGVAPVIGRGLSDDDERQGNEHVVVLSHDLWTGRFGGAPEIVGRSITLDGRPYRVIGVMPDSFAFPSLAESGMSVSANGELRDGPEFWTPLSRLRRPAGPESGGFSLLPTYALVRPNVTLEQAAAEVNTLMPALAGHRFRIELVSGPREEARRVRPALLTFQAAVLVVLFIAGANVTNLLLARAAGRRRELAIRLAIGASRGQVVRAAIAEALVICVSGAAIGCLLAYELVARFRRLPPFVLPRLSQVRLDALSVSCACLAALVTAVSIGVWTAFRAMRESGLDALAGTSTAGSGHRPSRVLVAAQAGSSVLLLAGAVLLLGSFVRLVDVDRGFDPSNVQTFRISLPARLQAPRAQYGFHDRLTAALRTMRGVEAVAASDDVFGSTAMTADLAIDGRPIKSPVFYQHIAPGLFETLRIPLRGRDFTPADRRERAQTAIVNETFARWYFPGADPIGRRLALSMWPALEIVGVAADVRPLQVVQPVNPTLYLPPETSDGFGAPMYLVRAADGTAPMGSIRQAAAHIDPDAVVFDATPMDTWLARQVATPRLYGLTAGGFAFVAVVLAAIGLYGVLSYSVGTRTREFGIRVAIGATSERLAVEVLRDALGTVLSGVAAGLITAYYSSRYLESLLFGVRAGDPVVLAADAAFFVAVALAAAYLPARRATQVDPIQALRSD